MSSWMRARRMRSPAVSPPGTPCAVRIAHSCAQGAGSICIDSAPGLMGPCSRWDAPRPQPLALGAASSCRACGSMKTHSNEDRLRALMRDAAGWAESATCGPSAQCDHPGGSSCLYSAVSLAARQVAAEQHPQMSHAGMDMHISAHVLLERSILNWMAVVILHSLWD